MKETKKEWKNPEMIVLSVNGDTEYGSGTSNFDENYENS